MLFLLAFTFFQGRRSKFSVVERCRPLLLLLKIEYKEIVYEENINKSIFSSFKDGINYLQTSHYLRNMIIFYLIFYFFMSVPGFLTPVLVSTKFSSDSMYLAINETIWFIGNGIGGFIMYKIIILYYF